MDKIKCPHCGAINQDVTEQDACWKCGKPLSAAAVVPTASGSEEASVVEAGGQRLKTQPTLEERVAARKEERLANRRANPAVPTIIVMLLLLIALLLYFFVFRRH